MSDRTLVIQMPTGAELKHTENKAVELVMDGDSGTWRLFLSPGYECVDFSLDGLRKFHDELGRVLRDIEENPQEFNAEVRRAWEV